MLKKSARILELDYFRGICILLMIFDHIMYFTIQYSYLLWNEPNNILCLKLLEISELFYIGKYVRFRYVIRNIVLIIFFIISGICCNLSRNNYKRFIKLAIMACTITIVSIIISETTRFYILIEWGVIHCYATCLLVFLVIRQLKQEYILTLALFFILIKILLDFYQPSLAITNIFMPLGVPSEDFEYAYEYFPILQWIGIYLLGVYIGRKYYTTKLSKDSSLKSFLFYPVVLTGQYGLIIYLVHFPIVVLFIYLIGL